MKNVKNDLFKGFQENAIVHDSMNQLFGGATDINSDPTPHYTDNGGKDCSSEEHPTTWGDTVATAVDYDTQPSR